MLTPREPFLTAASPLNQPIWGTTLWVTADAIISQINTLVLKITLFGPSQFPESRDTFLFQIELLKASFCYELLFFLCRVLMAGTLLLNLETVGYAEDVASVGGCCY